MRGVGGVSVGSAAPPAQLCGEKAWVARRASSVEKCQLSRHLRGGKNDRRARGASGASVGREGRWGSGGASDERGRTLESHGVGEFVLGALLEDLRRRRGTEWERWSRQRDGVGWRQEDLPANTERVRREGDAGCRTRATEPNVRPNVVVSRDIERRESARGELVRSDRASSRQCYGILFERARAESGRGRTSITVSEGRPAGPSPILMFAQAVGETSRGMVRLFRLVVRCVVRQ